MKVTLKRSLNRFIRMKTVLVAEMTHALKYFLISESAHTRNAWMCLSHFQ